LIEASQDGTLLSDLDIREEVDTFMFEVFSFSLWNEINCGLTNFGQYRDKTRQQQRSVGACI